MSEYLLQYINVWINKPTITEIRLSLHKFTDATDCTMKLYPKCIYSTEQCLGYWISICMNSKILIKQGIFRHVDCNYLEIK